MRKRPLFMHEGFYVEEEIGIDVFDDLAEDVELDEKVEKGTASSGVGFQFNAFLDGTMKLYRVAVAGYTGTPLFIASISAALLERGSDRLLRNTRFSRTVNAIFFPFKRYSALIKEDRVTLDGDVAEFINLMDRAIRIGGGRLVDESNLEGRADDVFGASGVWLLCDTSYVGITGGERRSGSVLLDADDLYNPRRVREAANARCRYLMGLLEFYILKSYVLSRNRPFVMVDGVLHPYKRVARHFGLIHDEYKRIITKAVGFIKHPRKTPPNVLKEIPLLEANRYFTWIGTVSGSEMDGTAPGKLNGVGATTSSEVYRFALFRFRQHPHLVYTPVGIVKIQVDEDVSPVDGVVNAVLRENLPVPTDRKRLFNEPYPIEVAEKVSKSMLPSEERIRGFVLSIIPALNV